MVHTINLNALMYFCIKLEHQLPLSDANENHAVLPSIETKLFHFSLQPSETLQTFSGLHLNLRWFVSVVKCAFKQLLGKLHLLYNQTLSSKTLDPVQRNPEPDGNSRTQDNPPPQKKTIINVHAKEMDLFHFPGQLGGCQAHVLVYWSYNKVL